MIKDILNSNEEILPNTKQIEVLKENFPACFNADGSFDIERFKEYLSDKLMVSNEGYELKFLGKNYARLLASIDTTTVIVPDEEHNNKPENKDSQNIYISGDNLDGLKQLLKSYAHQVKCIYIDPPYNTGSDGFVYNDNFNFSAEELSTKLMIVDIILIIPIGQKHYLLLKQQKTFILMIMLLKMLQKQLVRKYLTIQNRLNY